MSEGFADLFDPDRDAAGTFTGYGLRRNTSILKDSLIFLRYAYCQHGSIENGEDKRIDRQAERQRNGGELAGNYRIIGVAQKPIRAAPLISPRERR
jgi:hypothetical protein